MASINALQYGYSSTLNVTEKGLVLNTKEGFFRDIGPTLFNNSDYVRVGICFSVNLQSNPNTNGGINTNEKNTNSLLSNSFFMGLKTPNSNLPSTSTNTTKFVGFWLPPRGQFGGTLDFTGIAPTVNSFGLFIGSSFYTSGLVAGSLNQPFTFTQAQTSNSYNGTSFGNSPFIGGHYIVDEVAGSAARPNIWGIQFNKNGTASFEYEATGAQLNTGGAYLSALKNFVNNKPFLSNSISLTGSEYGNATSIFVYNPFQTMCIRVHGIIAAGFTS